MKIKKIGLLCMAVASAVLCICGGSGIYAMPSASVTNHFSTGIVDIHLKEFQLDKDGKEMAWTDNPIILPGTKISKIPRIYNDGNDCYVRAKVSFQNANGLDQDDLYGISDTWIKADDGFYYCKDIIRTGKSVDLFQGIQVPADFPQDEEGQTIYCIVDAEAVQSQNFTPDFNSNTPWGDIDIEKCKKEGQYDMESFRGAGMQSLRVEYQGEAESLFANPDDFFQNFPTLLPGDSYSDSAVLKNDSDQDIKLYFHTDADDASDLLDRMRLTIDCTLDGKKERIYDGSLRAERLNEEQLLGTIPAGTQGSLDFTVYVPEELDNDYTLLDSQVVWIFSTDKIGKLSDATGKAPKTGYGQRTYLYLLFAGISLACATIVIAVNRKEEES